MEHNKFFFSVLKFLYRNLVVLKVLFKLSLDDLFLSISESSKVLVFIEGKANILEHFVKDELFEVKIFCIFGRFIELYEFIHPFRLDAVLNALKDFDDL